MLKLGLTKKVDIIFSHEGGIPQAIANERIIVGEIIETVYAQHISIDEGFKLYESIPVFANCVQPNEIKLRELNQKTEALYQKLASDLMSSGEPSKDDLENLRKHPELLKFFNSYKWLDLLIGNIPYYEMSDLNNSRIVWDIELNLWTVVAVSEILPGKTITLPTKK